jgi:hypothetical protein
METFFLLITFDSTHKAIRTDKYLKERIAGELIPTPREISASCGLSFKFAKEEGRRVYETLLEKDGFLEGLQLYSMERTSEKRVAKKLEWDSLLA